MDLDRTSIERTEFPLVTPGYEPAAVQAHLRAVAEEVEALRRSGFRPGESLALTASAEVRAVLEAAERGAQAIRARAEEEAAAIVAEAEERALAGAVEVGQADRARLAETLAGITRALGEMLDGVGQLTGTLEGLAAPPVAEQPEEQPDGPAPINGAAYALPPLEPLPAPDASGELPSAATFARLSAQREDARLIALNMALNRTPRDEIDRYLASHFDLPDRGSVLDDVFRRIGR